MPYIEQLLFGIDDRTETPVMAVLGQSAGLSQEVAEELERLCRSWGDPPALGLQRFALMSMPVSAGMPSLRGKLYALIRVGAGDNPLFHAVVLNDQTYTAFGRNPFALAARLEFQDTWAAGSTPPRIEVETDPTDDSPLPRPGPEDKGLVDEAVLHVIETGKLILPLEQAVAESDRAMALIIAALPEYLRKELRFASFATSESNDFALCGLATEGGLFAGWQRVMAATGNTTFSPQVDAYRHALREHLESGDLNAIMRLSQRHEFQEKAPAEPQISAWQVNPPEPVQPVAERSVRKPVSQPAPVRPAFNSNVATAQMASPTRIVGATGVSGSGRGRSGLSRRGRELQRSFVPSRARDGKRGGRVGFVRILVALFVLFLAGWVGTMWRDGRTLSESLEWAGIPGMNRAGEGDEHGPSLLEAVDVAGVYERQRRSLSHGGFGSLNPSRDRARTKALKALRRQAAEPLFAQVSLFIDLSHEGVQLNGRPDRESGRLSALARQGAILGTEMARLELAWHSLATGVLWRDLGKLADPDIVVRRDSLARAERGAMRDARIGLGGGGLPDDLRDARRNTEGMAALVTLMQEQVWSDSWPRKLQQAAEMVLPASSRNSRAYRNGAFALARLKQAERAPDNRALVFSDDFGAGAWPSAEVIEQMRSLRREAGKFSSNDAPWAMTTILEFYTRVEDPAAFVAEAASDPGRLDALAAGRAMQFDREVYGLVLTRLRCDVMRRLFELGDTATLETLMPDDSRVAGELREFIALQPADMDDAGWRRIAAVYTDPFLAEWARQRATAVADRLLEHQVRFATAWGECRAEVQELRLQAATGRDWSHAWRSTEYCAGRMLTDYLSGDGGGVHLGQMMTLKDLYLALDQPLPLVVERATVRFAPSMFDEVAQVRLVLATASGTVMRTSDVFDVGHAAPAGSGWVGTVDLAWTLPLTCRDVLVATVVAAADDAELLRLEVASLAAGEGPAAWSRPRAAGTGSLDLRLADDYWQALDLPELDVLF